MFICPSLRARTLWQEVKLRLAKEFEGCQMDDLSHHAHFNNRHILIKTWNEVLTTIREFLVQNNEYLLVSDVDQLIGLCSTIDNNTFLPISDEDLSPTVPRRISSYYDLVDKVLDEIKKRLLVDLGGMKATPQRSGYNRYFKCLDLGLSLQLNFALWRKELDTPFWISFHRQTGGPWIIDDIIKKRVSESGKQFYYISNNELPHYPLVPPRNVTEDVVVKHLAMEAATIIEHMGEPLQ